MREFYTFHRPFWKKDLNLCQKLIKMFMGYRNHSICSLFPCPNIIGMLVIRCLVSEKCPDKDFGYVGHAGELQQTNKNIIASVFTKQVAFHSFLFYTTGQSLFFFLWFICFRIFLPLMGTLGIGPRTSRTHALYHWAVPPPHWSKSCPEVLSSFFPSERVGEHILGCGSVTGSITSRTYMCVTEAQQECLYMAIR